jgi:hypothetical protein
MYGRASLGLLRKRVIHKATCKPVVTEERHIL